MHLVRRGHRHPLEHVLGRKRCSAWRRGRGARWCPAQRRRFRSPDADQRNGQAVVVVEGLMDSGVLITARGTPVDVAAEGVRRAGAEPPGAVATIRRRKGPGCPRRWSCQRLGSRSSAGGAGKMSGPQRGRGPELWRPSARRLIECIIERSGLGAGRVAGALADA